MTDPIRINGQPDSIRTEDGTATMTWLGPTGEAAVVLTMTEDEWIDFSSSIFADLDTEN